MTSRRAVLTGMGLAPLASVLASPELARAAAGSTETVGLTTPGGRKVSGALSRPAGAAKGAIVLIHEWWGLNDQIKSVAVELARNGYVALAADLYDGRSTDVPDEARALTRSVVAEEATDTLVGWVEWLRADDQSHLFISCKSGQLYQGLFGLLLQGLLEKQVAAGVAGQAELREKQQTALLLSGLAA